MSDYNKLTVVKLREELVKRGLPKTGLKPVLVQRLQEADAQLQKTTEATDESAVENIDREVQEGAIRPEGKQEPDGGLDNALEREDADEGTGAPVSSDTKSQAVEHMNEANQEQDTKEDVIPAETLQGTATPAPQDEPSKAQPPKTSPSLTAPSEDPNPVCEPSLESQSDALPDVATQPASEPYVPLQLPTPAQTQSQQVNMTPVPDTQEMLEDSRKRKRRSQSPPPSSVETQKRLKADHVQPNVEIPGDASMDENELDQEPEKASRVETPFVDNNIPITNGHAIAHENEDGPKQNSGVDLADVSMGRDENFQSTQLDSIDPPIKPSPSDTRFKNLFTAPSKPHRTSEKPSSADTEDQVIGPAIHPATSALYIRELMRPLKPESIKEHILALATPADSPSDPNIITSFFLDSIRTHCLIGFANVSAASRVRSCLHDRIWPNERDRRPLFVDFVPEEKLEKWIDVEQNAPSGRGQPQKKWEVVYEDEDGAIKAYLQEVGPTTGGHQPGKSDSGQGVKGAPSGPRIRESEPRSVHTRPDNGKGFQALDDLFKSTSAKPKLYYQPVSKPTADQRLDKLAAGRGGGRSDEMRRYSFEDDLLVDKAPEFGNRGRGAYGSRGGFGGGYRGRGGGYRGDAYRGDIDNRRDRRPGY